ncbi:hypothetical protein RS86_03744 [Microbacterium azadirachtae]|uniref:Uncharacterized protein n=1 Tax=Microbacterium azadirachtae TaxID=582680 RepID=A0A0F0LEU1_9MICO|nr:hypothetical protein RS86_03744 [Microbacterium azadirachtae]
MGIAPEQDGSARNAQTDAVPVGRGDKNLGRAARPA